MSKRVQVLTILPAGVLAGLLCGCPQLSGVLPTFEGSAAIGPEGGRVQITSAASGVAGAFIEVPAGAVDSPVNITIDASNQDVLLNGASPISMVDIQPADTRFNTAVTIGLPLPAGASGLILYRRDAANAAWRPLANQSTDAGGRVVGTTNHLSLFALGAKPPVAFTAQLYYRNNQLSAGVQVATPLEAIAVNSQAASRFSTNNMRGVLEADPFAVRPVFYVTLMQDRAGSAEDIELQTVKIIYRLSDTFGEEALPSEVAAGVDDGPLYLRFPVDGERAQALDEMEQLFSGAPVLFVFDEIEPLATVDYYIDVRLFYTDEQGDTLNLPESGGPVDAAFETSTNAMLRRVADLEAPADDDGDGIINAFQPGTSDMTGRPVLAPVFLPVDVTEFTDTLQILIACGTEGASLRYTTDGSAPSRTNGIAIECGEIVTLTETTTLQAISFKDGMPDSAITEQTYVKTGG